MHKTSYVVVELKYTYSRWCKMHQNGKKRTSYQRCSFNRQSRWGTSGYGFKSRHGQWLAVIQHKKYDHIIRIFPTPVSNYVKNGIGANSSLEGLAVHIPCISGIVWGVSSVGRTIALQAIGRRFKPCTFHYLGSLSTFKGEKPTHLCVG